MADPDAGAVPGTRPSVFLSYASQDRSAARLLRDALTTYGIEVWYDESDLGGGEAWDQKIRRQIRDCDYFMPVISAQTEARHEGYFRREWRLAVERTLDMADDHPFLLPVKIDDTQQEHARVPDKFLAVQWLKVPGGQSTAGLEALCRRLVEGGLRETTARRSPERPRGSATPVQDPIFPTEVPGQRLSFGFHVVIWAWRSLWARFGRLPRWIRIIAILWLVIAAISRCTSSSPDHKNSQRATASQIEKLNAISKRYQGARAGSDAATLGEEIAREFSDADDEADADGMPLLALAFTAPAGDPAAATLANRAFAMSFGMATISHRGAVGLNKVSPTAADLSAAVARGKANHSSYVLHGQVQTGPQADQMLTVSIAKVSNGAVVWSNSYPVAGADPGRIAADVDAHVPSLKTRAN